MLPLAALGVGGLMMGGQLLSGYMQGEAAKDAAKTQAAQEQKALEMQQRNLDRTRSDYMPYLEAGTRNLGEAEKLISGYQAPVMDYKQQAFNFDTFKDPGAQYRMDQALKAIQGSASARGGLGGGVLRRLQQESQNQASQEYANSFNRWKDNTAINYGQAVDKYNRENQAKQYNIANRVGMANAGQGAVGSMAGQMGTATNSMAGILSNIGSANAAGQVGQANAYGNAINNATTLGGNLLKGYMDSDLASKYYQPKQGSI